MVKSRQDRSLVSLRCPIQAARYRDTMWKRQRLETSPTQRPRPVAWPPGPDSPHPRPSIRRSRSRRRPGNRLMDTRCLTGPVREQASSGPAIRRAGGLGKTEANVVVPVVSVVPVPVRCTQVLRFVVPGTAPNHALAVYWPVPLLNTAWEKITRRRPSVSACFAWPIQLCVEATTVAHSRRPTR